MKKSLTHSTQNLAICQTKEVSIFTPGLTKTILAKNIINIKKAFPDLPNSFYELFSDRILELNFSNDRLTSAVNNVIDNYHYKTPPLALFLSYDIKFKTYNYSEASQIAFENRHIENYIIPCRLPNNDKPVWCLNSDVQLYKIEPWNKTEETK